jgi:DNA polymerase (family 10)
MEKKKMTARILQALDNPYVNVLAHPTGRMINKREGYDADPDAIFRACASKHVALEINSDPRRLDLNGTLIMTAKKQKVKFSVGTDAHSAGMLGNIRFGLGQARRGWLEKTDLINTRSLGQLRKFLKARRG